jgi:hypothetical protein
MFLPQADGKKTTVDERMRKRKSPNRRKPPAQLLMPEGTKPLFSMMNPNQIFIRIPIGILSAGKAPSKPGALPAGKFLFSKKEIPYGIPRLERFLGC